ncbi:MAG: adenylate/guanylate cyclase domain-containing protein, partial [Acidobacteria bacterium]|nr:adenylate/guanylate cyclase domain-containing protein [Acidobacteriota bacterium]
MPALVETLTSYVPALITRRLAGNSNRFTEPTVERSSAAVLFADISGFTALTERLAARGPAGAEEMTHLLNTYFGQLVDLITSHGGDIVKFAGDAVLALWPTTVAHEDLATLTRRVAQCGVAVQERLDDYEVAEGVRLSLKLAIGAGNISTIILGGVFDRWEPLVTGAPLAQVGAANDHAAAGQVILSPEAWALVKDTCVGHTEDGYVRLEAVRAPLPLQATAQPVLGKEASAALRDFIPGAIRSRLDAGQTDWLAELRRVTIVFINLPDFKYDTPLLRSQEAMRALQTNLYRYEGSINKISVDDKGASLLAALGLPPLSHEDDAARGVRAALAMQADLRRGGFHSAIGVTTGQAFCGAVGSARRREYTLMGDVVNLAARLMQAAKSEGDILCDEATAHAARGMSRLNFDSLPALKVKGKKERVAVYRPALSTQTQRAKVFHAKARTR